MSWSDPPVDAPQVSLRPTGTAYTRHAAAAHESGGLRPKDESTDYSPGTAGSRHQPHVQIADFDVQYFEDDPSDAALVAVVVVDGVEVNVDYALTEVKRARLAESLTALQEAIDDARYGPQPEAAPSDVDEKWARTPELGSHWDETEVGEHADRDEADVGAEEPRSRISQAWKRGQDPLNLNEHLVGAMTRADERGDRALQWGQLAMYVVIGILACVFLVLIFMEAI